MHTSFIRLCDGRTACIRRHDDSVIVRSDFETPVMQLNYLAWYVFRALINDNLAKFGFSERGLRSVQSAECDGGRLIAASAAFDSDFFFITRHCNNSDDNDVYAMRQCIISLSLASSIYWNFESLGNASLHARGFFHFRSDDRAVCIR